MSNDTGNVIRIPLSKLGKKYAGKYEAVIDEIDKVLEQHNWKVLITKGLKYAVSNKWKEKALLLHREVLARKLERELLPTELVDHIDGNGLNNTRNNLRLATYIQNGANSKKHKRNTSGYKGVGWHKQGKKWRARLSVNGKVIHLGLYDTPELANVAVCEARQTYHGEYANNGVLNGD